MKKKPTTLWVAMIFALIANAQSNCSKFYPLKQGTKFQITSFDKNDKNVATIDYVVKESSGKDALLEYEMFDDKGKLMLTSEYGLVCKDDGISIDFKSLIAPGVFEQYKDMAVDISGIDILLPNDLTIGQTLPDADVLMVVTMNPIKLKMSAKIFNRKVEGMETISTPAGSFDCFVITFDHESKMGIKFSGTGKQWLAIGVGMVQQIDFNKKGKIVSKSLLTKYEK